MRSPHRPLAVGLALLATAVPLAACGDDEDESGSGGATQAETAEAKPLEIEATGSGQKTKLTVPQSAEAGLVELTFTNNAEKGEHGAQLLKVDSDKPAAEVLKEGNAWGDQGKPLPEYISFAGGIGNTPKGETASVTTVMEPGRYMVLDFGAGDQPVTAEFELTGEAGGELPAADGTVTAREYAFEAEGLKTGANRITFDNAGKEPHHLIAAPLNKGATREDIMKAFENENAPPPFDEKQAVEAPILSGGAKQVVELDLQKAGEYALMCFIPDRAGGPPHVAKGMVTTTTVE